jgi:histone H2B
MPKDFEIKNSFNVYIHKILKDISPTAHIDQHALNNINMMAHHIIDMVIAKGELIKRDHKLYGPREVQTSVQMILGKELSRHAVTEGTKAIMRFTNSASGTSENRIRKATRADNIIPPSLIRRILKEKSTYNSISDKACVFLSAVIEYILSEIIDVSSGRALMDHITVNTRDVMFGIKNDEELNALFTGVFNGGVMPNLHSILLPKRE